MKILKSETVITGGLIMREGKVLGDENCERIDELRRTHLKYLCHDASGWDKLYYDPDDGRLWEFTYPQSHLQGGGPPQLQFIMVEEARKKYEQFHGLQG
jgi:hypothetical protein